jgi:mono/diheme cytochrome c family protein
MRSRLLYLSLAAAAFVGTAACDEALSSLTGPTPNLEPTFASIQRNIFDQGDSTGRAACIQCHTSQGRTPAGGLDLTSGIAHGRLVGVASGQKPGATRVIAGDPNNSYLIQKLEGAQGIIGGRMPRGAGPYLTEGQMLVVRRWVQLGARND